MYKYLVYAGVSPSSLFLCNMYVHKSNALSSANRLRKIYGHIIIKKENFVKVKTRCKNIG